MARDLNAHAGSGAVAEPAAWRMPSPLRRIGRSSRRSRRWRPPRILASTQQHGRPRSRPRRAGSETITLRQQERLLPGPASTHRLRGIPRRSARSARDRRRGVGGQGQPGPRRHPRGHRDSVGQTWCASRGAFTTSDPDVRHRTLAAGRDASGRGSASWLRFVVRAEPRTVSATIYQSHVRPSSHDPDVPAPEGLARMIERVARRIEIEPEELRHALWLGALLAGDHLLVHAGQDRPRLASSCRACPARLLP